MCIRDRGKSHAVLDEFLVLQRWGFLYHFSTFALWWAEPRLLIIPMWYWCCFMLLVLYGMWKLWWVLKMTLEGPWYVWKFGLPLYSWVSYAEPAQQIKLVFAIGATVRQLHYIRIVWVPRSKCTSHVALSQMLDFSVTLQALWMIMWHSTKLLMMWRTWL